MTRDLSDIVDSLKVTESELGFQIARLSKTDGQTEDEDEHIRDLVKGYSGALHYIGILRRYQEGRLDRREADRDLQGDDPMAPHTKGG